MDFKEVIENIAGNVGNVIKKLKHILSNNEENTSKIKEKNLPSNRFNGNKANSDVITPSTSDVITPSTPNEETTNPSTTVTNPLDESKNSTLISKIIDSIISTQGITIICIAIILIVISIIIYYAVKEYLLKKKREKEKNDEKAGIYSILNNRTSYFDKY